MIQYILKREFSHALDAYAYSYFKFEFDSAGERVSDV